MANSSVTLKDSSGTNYSVDTETQSGGDHREVTVIGDPVAATEATVDSAGLQVSTQGRPITAVTGTITTSSSNVTATVSSAGNATITVNGTYAGVSYSFLASDDAGTNFYPVQVVREDTGMVLLSDTPGTNGKVSYLVDIPGWNQLRVLATAYTSGTANVRISPGGGPFVPVVSIGNSLASTAPAPTTVSVSTTAVQIIAADSNRRGVILWNNSSVVALIALGAATPTAALSSFPLQPQQTWESPIWTGRIAGITASGTASVNVTPLGA